MKTIVNVTGTILRHWDQFKDLYWLELKFYFFCLQCSKFKTVGCASLLIFIYFVYEIKDFYCFSFYLLMRKEILKYSQLSNIYINILIEYSPYILENWIITVLFLTPDSKRTICVLALFVEQCFETARNKKSFGNMQW